VTPWLRFVPFWWGSHARVTEVGSAPTCSIGRTAATSSRDKSATLLRTMKVCSQKREELVRCLGG
jgi:hypothetical protein